MAKSFSYQSQSCTCRQTWSIRSVRSPPPAHPGAQAAAGWRTGLPFRWGRTEWWSRRAALHKKTWACWLSSCRTSRWWRTRPWRTGSKLSMNGEKPEETESLKEDLYKWMLWCNLHYGFLHEDLWKIVTIMMTNGHIVLTINACSLQHKYTFNYGCVLVFISRNEKVGLPSSQSSRCGFICFARLIPVGVAGARDTQTIDQKNTLKKKSVLSCVQ